MSAEPIMRASDYANAIEDQVQLVRHYRALKSDGTRIANRVAELRQKATELNAQADRLEAEYVDAEALEERAQAEIRKLRTGLAMHKERAKVSTINKLVGELSELDPAALAAIIAQLEAKAGE